MLHYLKIFSILLLGFGVIRGGALLLGVDLGSHIFPGSLGLMGVQVLVAAVVLYGFRLQRQGRMSEKLLTYAGWGLVAAFVVAGQVWVNA
ncbi:hypothetical protein [Motiliproteus sp. SC1-56]|uniref:hypothetical protein n=1 Tax=Motiliproteus sp. SC1-56 TaxID=2799565 RepID=UPI001A8CE6D4|nr:hypothetical protein [Motiliproteus sp. SC1-56]